MTENRTPARRIALIAIPVVILLAVAAAILVPRWYAETQNANAPAPLGFTPTAEPSAGTGDAPTEEAAPDLAGEWSVGEGSEAGYRIDEVLNGEDVTVVGRTDQVSGTVTVNGSELTAGTIEVDTASIATDSDRRDGYFRENALQTADNPTATFEVTEPIALTTSGEPSEVEVTGDLTLAGQTNEVSGTFEQVLDGEEVVVSGAVDVDVTEFGIEPPNLGFVTVESEGQVEFLLRLSR